MIHPTAIISHEAVLGVDLTIGPYCVIGAGVVLGDRCVLHSHVVMEGPCRIGAENEFFPFAVIGGKTQDLKYIGEPTHLEIGDHNVFRENTTVHRVRTRRSLRASVITICFSATPTSPTIANSAATSSCRTTAPSPDTWW